MTANIWNCQYLCHAISGLKFLGVFAKLRKATNSFAIRLSVLLCARKNSAHTPHEFSWNLIFEDIRKSVEKIQISWNLTRITGTLDEDQYVLMIVSTSYLLRLRTVSRKSCRENKNTHFVYSNFFFSENQAFYEIMWKNSLEQGRPQMTIWRMRAACWIPKVTARHSEYVIIVAFPGQQWSREHVSMLRYTYTACLAHM
jgi:hypothetical protein